MNASLFDFPMPIETPRLILQTPKIGDGKMVNEAVIESIEELRPFMPWAKKAPSIHDTEEFVRLAATNWILKKNEEPYLPLFIFDKKTHHFIGSTGFHHFDWKNGCIEIGYWLRTTYTGQGLMTEAVNALTQYAFTALNMKRVVITCTIDNVKSKKIPDNLGYTLESTAEQNQEKNITDSLIFSRYHAHDLPPITVSW